MGQLTEYAELIYAALLSAMPALTAILGVVIACHKTLINLKGLRRSVDEKTDVTELKIALNQCLKENAELKKAQRKLLAKLEHIDEADLED